MAKSKSSKPGKRGKGRPSLFTPDTCGKILNAISVGTPLKLAPLVGGVKYSTFRSWIVRGEKEKGAYRAFAHQVDVHKAKAVTRWLAVIEKAGQDGSWQAMAWKLERKYPDEFGRRERREVTGKDGKPIEFVFPNLNNEDTRSHYRALFGEAVRGGEERSESRPAGNGSLRN